MSLGASQNYLKPSVKMTTLCSQNECSLQHMSTALQTNASEISCSHYKSMTSMVGPLANLQP